MSASTKTEVRFNAPTAGDEERRTIRVERSFFASLGHLSQQLCYLEFKSHCPLNALRMQGVMHPIVQSRSRNAQAKNAAKIIVERRRCQRIKTGIQGMKGIKT